MKGCGLHSSGVAGWPGAGEELQIQRDIALSELTGCPIHIQHITTARGVDIVRQGKSRGIKVICEATPHHIVLNEDNLTSTYNTISEDESTVAY